MSAPYTLIGTPYSTFTRTIALGSEYEGLKYDHKSTPPHSNLANRHHPFVFLPAVVIHEIDGKKVDDILLRESRSIVRFIDRIAPEPSLHVTADTSGTVIEEEMWEMVDPIAFLGFSAVNIGIVKPRFQALNDYKPSDAEQSKEESKN